MVLQNHKNVENIKLMNFLFSRQTSRNLDMTYENGGQHFQQSISKKANDCSTDFTFNRDI